MFFMLILLLAWSIIIFSIDSYAILLVLIVQTIYDMINKNRILLFPPVLNDNDNAELLTACKL